MADTGISLSELARRLGRNKSTLQRQAGAGTIPRNADKSFDEDAVRKALAERLDPARAKPLKPAAGEAVPSLPHVAAPPVATLEDAQEAVALIRRILAEEGRAIEGAPTFDDVRSADLILKARERALSLAVQEGELTPTRPALKHIAEAFSGYKRELQAMPARLGAQMAAEIGCDVGALDRALTKAIREYLEMLSAPVVRP